MLSERRQSQMTIYHTIPFIQNVQNRQVYKDEIQCYIELQQWGNGK